MIRRLWVMIAILCMAFTFVLKANAQQPPIGGKPKGYGEGEQLRQEIAALEQQAKPLREQVEHIEAQAKPIRAQLRPIQEKIKDDRKEMQQNSQQQQAPAVPQQK